MPTLHLEDVPDELVETIRRSAADRNRTVAEEAVELMAAAVKIRELLALKPPEQVVPTPTPVADDPPTNHPDSIPDCLIAPHIIPDVWPEVPSGWRKVTVVPTDGGRAEYRPCCEFEEETPE